MIESIEALGSLLIVFMFIAILLSVFFIRLGLSVLNIRNKSTIKILWLMSFISFITYGTSLLFYSVPYLNTVEGFMIGMIVAFYLFRFSYQIKLAKALFLTMLNMCAHIIAVLLGSYLFVGAISDFLSLI